MPANKRSKYERERDLCETAARYLRGEPQASIARSLGVSTKQINYDVARIKERWRQNAIRDVGSHQSEQLAKLALVEAEAWQAWQRSLQPLQHSQTDDDTADVTVRSGHAGQGRIPARRTRKRSSRRTDEQCGNPSYLLAIERCIALRSKILGLLAPTRVTLDGRLSFDDLYNLATGQDASGRPDLHLLPAPDGDEDDGQTDALDAP